MPETIKGKEKTLLIYSRGELLGDGLLKLPALSVLRSLFPEYQITWCAGCGRTVYARHLKPLVEDYLDEVIDMGMLGISWREFLQKPALTGPYDTIIDSQNIVRSTLLLKRVPHELFVSPAAGFLFSNNKPKDKQTASKGSVQQRLIKLFELASGNKAELDFTLKLPAPYEEQAASLLPEGKTYIGFAPGAGGKPKRWPLEKFLEIAKAQEKKGRTPVFFLGPDEKDMFSIIKSAVPKALFPEQENQNTQTRGPLLSIALAERIQLGLSNDSGAGHIMSISGCPLISLFGHTNVEKFVDQRPQRYVIEASDFGGKEIERIPAENVLALIEEVLA